MKNAKKIIFIFLASVLFISCVFLQVLYLHKYCLENEDFYRDYYAAKLLKNDKIIYDGINHHVPLIAVIFLPLTLLEKEEAFFLWGIFSIVLYYFCIWIVARKIRLRLRLWWIPVFGLMSVWFPFLSHLALGQWSLVIATSIFVGWALLKNDYNRFAGSLFGFATALKLFPGLIGLYLLMQRRWRALIYMLIIFFVFTTISYLVVGSENFWAFVFDDMPKNKDRFIAYFINHSMWAMVQRLFVNNIWLVPLIHAPEIAKIFSIFLSIFIIFSLILGLSKLEEDNERDIGFSVICVSMLLLCPLTWGHSFVILILPIGVLLKEIWNNPTPGLKIGFTIALILLAIPDIPWARFLINLFIENQYVMPSWLLAIGLMLPAISLWVLLIMLLSRLPKFSPIRIKK